MNLMDLYELGKKSPLRFNVKQVDEKLKFVEFPYDSAAVIGLSLSVFVISAFLTFASYSLSWNVFFTYLFFFVGTILAVAFFIYPSQIFYTQRIIGYTEEMLKAIMRISTYISMNMSMEYAIIHTREHLWGTLRTQFDDIVRQLKHREKNTLGEVFEQYTPIWNEVNPDFVKALRLVETAAMSPPKDRTEILLEVEESLIISYHTAGKRFAEDLSNKAKSLVALGVLFPIISLMLLPLVSVFMPGIVTPPLLAFTYNVVFPSVLLIMALNFSAKRIQVDTIRLKDSPMYKAPSIWLWVLGLVIIVIFAVPTVVHLVGINMGSKETIKFEYEFTSIIVCWLLSLGIFLAVILMSYINTRNYEKLWNEVNETELDLPHLLQTFSTYLTLNVSVENIIPEIIDDYRTHGFGNHPTVKFFSQLFHQLQVTKKSIAELTEKMLPKICPSRKVSGVLSQIVSFTEISQRSAGRAAKMVRKQTIAIYRLDDYIRTLLSDTVSLINITTIMLAPMLCAAAVLMSVAIVKALVYIQGILEGIGSGMGARVKAGLVDITVIIPPTIIEVIISLYLIELILVLSIFSSNIKIGNDSFQLVKSILANMVGFIFFSLILLFGYYAINNWIFSEFFATP